MAGETTVLFSCSGTLYQNSGEEDGRPHYDPLGDLDSFTISIEKRKKTSESAATYAIVVAEDEENVFEQELGVDVQLSYSNDAASAHWMALIEDELQTVAFRFSTPENRAANVSPQMYLQRFVTVYNECVYSLYTGYNVDPDDEWYNYLAGTNTHELRNENVTKPVFEFDASRISKAETGAGNICAAESMQFNRVLVIKKSNEEATLEMQAMPFTERGFSSAEAERVAVDQVDSTATGTLLENGDVKLLLFGGKKAAVQQVDLSRGTVVQEFKPKNLDIQTLSYANHTSAESGSVYTCLSRNVAFNIDTRMDPRSCVVMEDGKNPSDYALNSLRKDFTCHATSRNGYLVIGDGTGSIRLYTGPPGARKPAGGYFPKAAKTLLETKTPVVDIDVTADGKYIVATTAQRLLFIETKYVADNDKETNGFQGRMGAHKPKPSVLEPTPKQIMQMGGASAVRFQGAKFDRFPGTEELCVTASCGNYVLTWSLRNIIDSQKNGRAAVNSAVTVGQVVLSTSANRAENVGFLTGKDVGLVPFQEAEKQVGRAWTWGQKK